MAKEIERKFLVSGSSYRTQAVKATELTQAYLSTNADSTVRVRIAGDRAFLTVKSRNRGAVRGEWEYEIPLADARAMIGECAVTAPLAKTRYLVPAAGGLTWEVDEFHGALAPLVLAEIELPEADAPLPCPLPDFIGKEVTGDPEYYNSRLAERLAEEA